MYIISSHSIATRSTTTTATTTTSMALPSSSHFRLGWTAGLYVLGLCLCLSTLTSAAVVTDEITPEEIRKLELFAGDVMSCAYIPGMSIGVIRGNATFATGLGLADMQTGHPAGKTTTFNLGTTAKAFVPYILALILDSKYNAATRFTFDSTLGEFKTILGDLEIPEDWKDMTLKEMLLYESGSTNGADLGMMVGLPSNLTRDEMIRRLRFLPKTEEYQRSNHHSNYLYTIVGHLVQKMTSKTWKELVKQFVVDRHGMNLTTFSPHSMTMEDVALPYRYQDSNLNDPWVGQNSSLFEMHPSEPVAAVMAPSVDMARWLRDLLHETRGKGANSGNTLSNLFHEWVTVPEDHHTSEHLHHDSQKSLGYGMGWESSSYRGFQRYTYSGRLYAYRSQIWLFPEVLSAVYVSVNGPNSEQADRAIDGILFHASDLILRQDAWVSSDIACCCEEDRQYEDFSEEAAPETQVVVKYLVPADKYEGVYGHGLFGNVKIQTNAAGILEMRLGRNLFGELMPSETANKLRFVAKQPLISTREWEGEKMIEFLSNSGREFASIKFHINANLSYDFKRGNLFEAMFLIPDVAVTVPTTQDILTESIVAATVPIKEVPNSESTITEETSRLPSTQSSTKIENTDGMSQPPLTSSSSTLDSTENNATTTIASDDKDKSYIDNRPRKDGTGEDSFQRDSDEKSLIDRNIAKPEPKSANSARRKEGKGDLAEDGIYAHVDESTTDCFLNAASITGGMSISTLIILLLLSAMLSSALR